MDKRRSFYFDTESWLRRGGSRAPTIYGNCNNNNRTNDDFLNVVGPTDLLTTIAKKGHD